MSIWNKNEKIKLNKNLEKDIETDILVIGAGMTGLTLAYYLKNQNVCVVDASRIGHGTTLNTTAKINYFQERIYTKINNITNKEKAIKYLSSQKDAISYIKKIIKEENINCDFHKVDSYVFANSKKEIEKLDMEINFLKEQNINIIEKKLPINIKTYKSYCVNDTYIFNPIKYLKKICKILKENNVNIYENTKIIKIVKNKDNYICYTKNNKIKANKVVLACHYPYFLFPLLLPLKSYIEKSYIIVSEVKENKNFTCISSSKPTYSCRFYQDQDKIYQISLSQSHNTSIKQNDKYNFEKTIKNFNLKKENIIEKYTNTDIITPDYMPYIGKLKQNLYIGVGYNTWGMTNSILAAKIISDLILEKQNKYETIFNPNRFNLAHIIKLPLIIFSQIKSYFGPKINKNKKWYNNKIIFKKINGKNIAIYKDEKNKNHIIYNKCPHLGCSLIFNEIEKTWDCPCHSSRFDIDGKCIKGPSNYDISYKENNE